MALKFDVSVLTAGLAYVEVCIAHRGKPEPSHEKRTPYGQFNKI